LETQLCSKDQGFRGGKLRLSPLSKPISAKFVGFEREKQKKYMIFMIRRQKGEKRGTVMPEIATPRGAAPQK